MLYKCDRQANWLPYFLLQIGNFFLINADENLFVLRHCVSNAVELVLFVPNEALETAEIVFGQDFFDSTIPTRLVIDDTRVAGRRRYVGASVLARHILLAAAG